jgi:hypothetical protein
VEMHGIANGKEVVMIDKDLLLLYMVLLREAISGRADDLILGQKKLNLISKLYYSAI